MGFWSRKAIDSLNASAENSSASSALPRSLGVMSLTAFGIGNTVGAGIFVLTGSVAALNAGPAVALSFVFASVVCFFAALCYAEFAAMAPVAGSAYSYAYASFGEGIAWIIGWSIMLEYLFSASVVAIGWSGYLVSALNDWGITFPAVLAGAPIKVDAVTHHLVATGAWFDLPAVLVIAACSGALLLGTRESSLINNVIVTVKVIAIVTVVICAAHYVDVKKWTPFVPPNTGEFGHFGWSGVTLGAAIVFFSYIGFDGISTLAEETKNPQRALPLSLLLSLAICTGLYVVVSLFITGLGSYQSLNVPDPLYHALKLINVDLGWLKELVAVVAIVGLISVVFTSLLGQSRIFYAMGRDGLLPKGLAATSKRFKTPYRSILFTGAASAITAGIVPLGLLGELISIGTLMAFAIVCAGIAVLRRTAPHLHRPFRTPLVPLVPALGVISSLVLMFSLPGDTWIRLVVWLVIGMAIYVFYGRHRTSVTG